MVIYFGYQLCFIKIKNQEDVDFYVCYSRRIRRYQRGNKSGGRQKRNTKEKHSTHNTELKTKASVIQPYENLNLGALEEYATKFTNNFRKPN